MAETSSIEWTDATWNPILGCTLDTPGCIHCYAMKLAGGRLKNHPSRAGLTMPTKGGPVWTGEVRWWEPWALLPLHWRKPKVIFVCAHSDIFHPDVPEAWIDHILAVAMLCQHHTFQLLTKRSPRMRLYFSDPIWRERVKAKAREIMPSSLWNGSLYQGSLYLDGLGVLPNVWAGVSIEDGPRLYRLNDLRDTPAAHRFISAEPLLGSPLHSEFGYPNLTGIDQVTAGGESGNKARPCHPEWGRDWRDLCAQQRVRFMWKQWGSWAVAEQLATTPTHFISIEGRLTPAHQALPAPTDVGMICVGKGKAGRLLDGRQHNDMPS